jgi:hypothetical protein
MKVILSGIVTLIKLSQLENRLPPNRSTLEGISTSSILSQS